ncbi:MAG: HlyD family efflux transporter periplasmic adaptor subunit [Labilithrix sp.]|nr:HlyD family efflux transporter periplasmic adaptor subunit [Labilithrix sp.]MBX3211169.1 HlyD family efflux transporter periplasmic adaptor subunit [Labilithrix sp.]
MTVQGAVQKLNGAAAAAPRRSSRKRLESFDVRSGEIREVLEGTPSRLLRQGIAAVVLSSVIVTGLLSWIRWPEVVDGRVVVTSHDPPVPVAARADGRLENLYVSEGESVERGKILAIVESSARGEHVLALSRAIDRLSPELERDAGSIAAAIDPSWELGELRAVVSAFVQSVEDERAFRALEGFDLRLGVYRKELGGHDALEATVGAEREMLAKSLQLLASQVERDRELATRGGLPIVLQAESERKWLEEQTRLKELEATLLRNKLSRLASERATAELSQLRLERTRSAERAVREAFRKLQAVVAEWMYRFALRAPTSGRVSFFEVWGPDQRIKTADEVLYVVPESMDLVGRVTLPQVGAGRVRVGQSVRVRFDSHPPSQFGTVGARVRDISAASRRSELLVTLDFPAGLETSYGRALDFKQGMSGSASIVTDDVRLLTRILGPLRHVIVNGPSAPAAEPTRKPEP